MGTRAILETDPSKLALVHSATRSTLPCIRMISSQFSQPDSLNWEAFCNELIIPKRSEREMNINQDYGFFYVPLQESKVSKLEAAFCRVVKRWPFQNSKWQWYGNCTAETLRSRRLWDRQFSNPAYANPPRPPHGCPYKRIKLSKCCQAYLHHYPKSGVVKIGFRRWIVEAIKI